MKVYLMQDSEKTAPYWFPKPCYHCDNPQCVSVCPVGATYKRSDGIVLIDNERCIGCKFCMTDARIRRGSLPGNMKNVYSDEPYSPERSVPGVEGTVSKCDFCPDLAREGKLPYCAQACPMGVIYFGDIDEDVVTNGTDTYKFSELIRTAPDTDTSRIWEPARMFTTYPRRQAIPVERGFDGLDKEIQERYDETPFVINRKKNHTGDE
jgi:molybdopterin-containing oxidoreductase family iron-sulfur binding subunit